MLADRSGYGDAIDEIGSFVELDDAADDAAVPEEEYLGAAGVDVDAVTAAGEDAARGRSPDARTHRDIVESALRDLDDPSEREVVDYARERDVPAEAASQLLERMVRAGEASENRGRYRLL